MFLVAFVCFTAHTPTSQGLGRHAWSFIGESESRASNDQVFKQGTLTVCNPIHRWIN